MGTEFFLAERRKDRLNITKLIVIFFFRHYNFNSLNVLAFSTYNFQFLRSWMQLVQLFILSFLCHSLCHLPICSLVSLVVLSTSFSTCILFLKFFLLVFDVNGQTNSIFVLLCNLLSSYVKVIVASRNFTNAPKSLFVQ
jgi:hypothetical protein